ncbi:MAG: helical backbone metal receptor [Ilumatobacteraceae bacterium]
MARSRFRPSLALAAIVALGLTACGSDDASSEPETAAPSTTSLTTSPDTSAGTGPTSDMRIVSLSPSATEMIYAIGAGDLVVAVDDQSNFPAEALDKATDLSGYTPNIEAIATYTPTLVLHDGTNPDLSTQLASVGIDEWIGAAPSTFDDLYVQLEQLGAATGYVADAAKVVASMQSDIDAAVQSIGTSASALRFYHELDDTFYSITSNTFIGQVYGMFGLRNIADTAEGTTDYPQLSAEFIISQSPELIFLADTKCCGQSADTVAARKGWGAIAAVANGDVVELDDDIASRWGPRVVDLVQQVAESISRVTANA